MKVVHWLLERGGLLVLLIMAVVLSLITIEEHTSASPSAARRLVEAEVWGDRTFVQAPRVFVAVDDQQDQRAFADAIEEAVTARGGEVVRAVGTPIEIRQALEANTTAGLTTIVSLPTSDAWNLLEGAGARYPDLENVPLLAPEPYRWPTFLTRDNLLNIAEKIAVWAILGIGMTLVILTAGIDLSVGSLVALSSVIVALLVAEVFGGASASGFEVFLASLAAIGACGLAGGITGLFVTRFQVAPFIVTLGMMMAASGTALRLTGGTSIDQVPDSFAWLGHGDLLGIPIAIVVMLVLYAAAWVLMTHTTVGRAIYAVGANQEAARLAGIPVQRVLLFVYVLSGALAGVGGLITASTFESGDPNYGLMYELYVIAAVVVGGTSLAGGQGKVMGTLVGALILGVIYNGMNLTGVGGFSQRIVLGVVILAAVVLDQWKRRTRD